MCNQRLFVDMDGTLAQWRTDISGEEEYYKEGYFLHLNPMQNVIDAVKKAIDSQIVPVYILSAVVSDTAVKEKKEWLKRVGIILPEDHLIFPMYGQEEKFDAVKKITGKAISHNDILIDDYTYNLTSWEKAGGTAIKIFNGVNGKGVYTGRNYTCAFVSADNIYRDIMRVVIMTTSSSD